MKIILGAGNTTQPGWTSLEFDNLDIRRRDQWLRLFQPGTVDAVLTEHVMEHLVPADAETAARNVFEFLKPGGYWRIAVPDANNPNPAYHDHCTPRGFWHQVVWPFFWDKIKFPNHKVFFSIETLSELLNGAGFQVSPLEWYDRGGQFHRNSWSQNDGQIFRAWETEHTKEMRMIYSFDNISLLVDAIKP